MAQALSKSLLQACGIRYIASNSEFLLSSNIVVKEGLMRGVLVQDMDESNLSRADNTVDNLNDLDVSTLAVKSPPLDAA